MTSARCQRARAEKRGLGWGGGSRRGVIRRGFSILELLIVLALVLAVLSLAMPSLTVWATAGERESREQFASAAMMARGAARERGITVELWAEGAGNRLVIRRAANPSNPNSEETGPTAAGPVLERLDELPGGARIGIESDAEVEGLTPPSERVERAILLAVFWAGGGSELQGSWSLRAGADTFRPVINEWTGSIQFEAVDTAAEAGDTAPAEPVPEEGEPSEKEAA
ncbi:hypothetical protein PHYC_00191 [Phycisphaerales bacterium]|nr:hypothetical protein PHYC_00191 [Phycisphaerales bacterium]